MSGVLTYELQPVMQLSRTVVCITVMQDGMYLNVEGLDVEMKGVLCVCPAGWWQLCAELSG